MPKNGYQPTIPALLNRKRRIDHNRAETSTSTATHKRRSGTSRSNEDAEVIILDTPEKESRPDTPEEQSPDKDIESVNRLTEVTFSRFRDLSCCPLARPSPLPRLRWAESDLLWKALLKQDMASKTQRGEEMFIRNPQVQPRMRSILLDWLIEVADVYKLHRETYYLAQDYVDRVLLIREDTPKQELQLLGITCLFLAAKVEEIYPPKVAEFAYVTDGACTEAAILEHEMSVLMTLEWQLCPLTPAGWLRFYLQLACQNESCKTRSSKTAGSDFEFPRFPAGALPLVSKLLDLATLDAGCVNFPYSVLAAAALALVYGRNVATTTSRIDWNELRPCIAWMAPFAVALSTNTANSSGDSESHLEHIDEEVLLKPELRPTSVVSSDNVHNLQSHSVSMELLELAQTLLHENCQLEELEESNSQTPANKPRQQPEETPEGLLTPPASRGKVLTDVTSKTANTKSGWKELFSSTVTLTPRT